MVFVPTTRNAKVSVDFKDYGIANLDFNGKFVYDTNGNIYNDEKYTLYSDFVMPSPFNYVRDGRAVLLLSVPDCKRCSNGRTQ